MSVNKLLTSLTLCCMALCSTHAVSAVESTWYGSFNTGVRFNSTPITQSKDLEVYNDQGSFIGLDAYSGYDTFYVRGRLEVDMNGSTLGGNLTTKQSFVELGQNGGFYRIGSIMSLVTQIMVQPNNIMHSQRSMEHIAFNHSESAAPYKSNVFQMQFPYEQNLMTYFEFEMDAEDGDELFNDYTAGIGIVSDEGSITYMTFKDNINNEKYWAIALDYRSAQSKYAITYSKGEGVNTWDTALSYQSNTLITKSSLHVLDLPDLVEANLMLGMDFLIGEQGVAYFEYSRLFDQQGAYDLSAGIRIDF
ncbi:hypothetical protein [Marinicellulosiphila megalodicopiae]|uniref:hypothetical protein n=1 Tax=Marinicellulosiphila megalodicopiae TaxID=2724896 RepID=UPI003BB01F87